MNKEMPSYYSIIPANVRYDKTLKANEKLLYGEITALTQKTGKCFARNSYFAEIYGVDKCTISRWIKNLCDKGYIKIDIEYSGKQIINRYIQIDQYPIDEKVNTPIDEKVKDNNTSNNNTSNNNIDQNKFDPSEFEEFWKQYPRKVGKHKAIQVWKLKKPPLDECLSKLEEYKQCEQWQDKSLIPHPTTWLNRGSWEDEVYTYKDWSKEEWDKNWKNLSIGQKRILDKKDPEEYMRLEMKYF